MDFGRYVFSAPYWEWLCCGVAMTIIIALSSSVLAALVSLVVLRSQLAGARWLRALGVAFVLVFRNLPMVPLLLLLSFGVPGLWRQLWGQPLPRGLELPLLLVGLALNTAAYFAEILRAGVGAVSQQQVEAARTLGLRPRSIRRRVVYPQAIRIVGPALASRFIHNMKNASFAVVVPLPLGSMEVVGQAGRIAGQTFSWPEVLVVAAAVYLALALGASRLLERFTRNAAMCVETMP